MSVQRRLGVRTPWLLPIILAIVVILIVLGFVFGSRIKSASSSPTATPTPTTIPTATSTSSQGTTGGNGTAIPPTATPGPNGASTPLPRATPVPTVVGLTLGMITRPQHEVTTIQRNVDAGNTSYTYYLDPRAVVQNNLPHYGFTKTFEIVAPNPSPTPTPHIGPDGRHIVDFYVSYQNSTYTVVTAQPGKTGRKGIWIVIEIVPGRQTI